MSCSSRRTLRLSFSALVVLASWPTLSPSAHATYLARMEAQLERWEQAGGEAVCRAKFAARGMAALSAISSIAPVLQIASQGPIQSGLALGTTALVSYGVYRWHLAFARSQMSEGPSWVEREVQDLISAIRSAHARDFNDEFKRFRVETSAKINEILAEAGVAPAELSDEELAESLVAWDLSDDGKVKIGGDLTAVLIAWLAQRRLPAAGS